MTPEILNTRTKKFTTDTIKYVDKVEGRSKCLYIITNQHIKSSTSVGTNYRARLQAEFISKIKIVKEEADECQYWMEVLKSGEIVTADSIESLEKEAAEQTAIFSASAKTTKDNKHKS